VQRGAAEALVNEEAVHEQVDAVTDDHDVDDNAVLVVDDHSGCHHAGNTHHNLGGQQ